MRLFVPLDVDYQFDQKIIAAGALAECLFVRSLALAKRDRKDGRIDAHHLGLLAYGIPGKAANHAAKLVDVGLWSVVPGGWQISGWLKRNASAEAVDSKQEQKRLASLKANHTRWHHGKEADPACPFCDPNRIRTGVRNGQRSESIEVEVEAQGEEQEEERVDNDNDDSTVRATPTPSSSVDLVRMYITAVASEMANRRTDLTNRNGWIHGTAAKLNAEHRAELDQWAHDGTTPAAAAARLLARGAGHPSAPTRPETHADPHCQTCGGDGLQTIDDNGRTVFDTCPCVRPEPYIATVHQIRGTA